MIFNDDRELSDIQEVTATCREMCCPSWKHYAIFELLFLQRNNNSLNQPLALDQDTNDVLLSTSGMQSTTAMGARIFYGKYGPNNVGWEIGYLGVYGMFGSQQVTGAENLRAPGDLGNGINSNFNDAELMRSTYSSTLNMAEANLFFYECCGDRNPSSMKTLRYSQPVVIRQNRVNIECEQAPIFSEGKLVCVREKNIKDGHSKVGSRQAWLAYAFHKHRTKLSTR